MGRKPKSSEDILEDYGITFVGELLPGDELKGMNRQAWLLRQYLLDFQNLVTEKDYYELEMPIGDEKLWARRRIRPPTIQEERNQHAREEYRKNFDIATCEAKVDLAYAIRKAARAIRSEEENRWTNVIIHLLFGTLHKGALDLEQPNPYRNVVDAIGKIRVDSDRPWTLGGDILLEKADIWDEGMKITDPKPDLCLSFHAYTQRKDVVGEDKNKVDKNEVHNGKIADGNTTNVASPQEREDDDPNCARNDGGPMHADPYISNFGSASLTRLYEHHKDITDFKPYSSPFDRFYRPGKRQYCDQACFPWAICEWKKHVEEGKTDNTSSRLLDLQIAKAGAVAATMFANITAAWHGKPILEEVRPVVCFWFIGASAEVKMVWIHAITEEGRYQYVRTIWKGSMHNVCETIELCWIIERLHLWAMYHLRPWISSCIDAWNLHKCWSKKCALHSLLAAQDKGQVKPQHPAPKRVESSESEFAKQTTSKAQQKSTGRVETKKFEQRQDDFYPPKATRRDTGASVASKVKGGVTRVFSWKKRD